MKSMYLALVALIVAALAFINSFCSHIENGTLIVSFLGILVTLLVGWNIIQFIFAENRMKDIAKEATKETAFDVICTYKVEDILKSAKQYKMSKRYMKAIDLIFDAIDSILSLKEREILQYEIGVASQLLLKTLLESQDKGGLWVLQDKRPRYGSLLQVLPEAFRQQCTALVYQAEEHPESDDGKLWNESLDISDL